MTIWIHPLILFCPACARSPRLAFLEVLPPADSRSIPVALCPEHYPRYDESIKNWRHRALTAHHFIDC